MNSDSSSSQRPRVSLRDLAKELGVSHVTVSLALRNHPRISEAMRRKIQETAERHGYRPDPMLAALANYRKSKSEHPITSAIAWINAWPDPAELRKHREFDLYWQGAFAAAEKFGYRIEEFQIGKNLAPQRLHQILSTRGIRGLMLPPQKAQPDWGDFPWGEYSVVRFGRSLKYPRSHLVTADQVANTILAFEKMRERGYRRIGFVTDENDQQRSGHLFEAGYLVAQRSVDESERIPIFTAGGLPPGQQFLAMANWIRANKVDAIFTDRAEVPKVLKKAGISVPGDVGLAVTTVLDTGVDTGIDQHPEEIGRVGFLLLASLINDGSRGVPPIFRQILVEGSWVDGESLPSKAGGQLLKQKEKA
jgi:LacI family transcriptional regulator